LTKSAEVKKAVGCSVAYFVDQAGPVIFGNFRHGHFLSKAGAGYKFFVAIPNVIL